MNPVLTPRYHALLARKLIAACDGLTSAEAACRASRSSLSNYQNPNQAAQMPADVMGDLEAYCGEAIYSGALARHANGPSASGDLLGCSLSLSSCATSLASEVHAALEDGTICPRERDELRARAQAAQDALGSLLADLSKIGRPS